MSSAGEAEYIRTVSRSLLIALSAFSLAVLHAADTPPFDELRARAEQMGETLDGKAYETYFSQSVSDSLQRILQGCAKETKPPYMVNIVFVINEDGTTRIVPAPDQPVSACVTEKLKGIKVPAPPKPEWMVLVNITVQG